MTKIILGILLVLGIGAGGVWLSLDDEERALVSNMPTDTNVLFWSVEQRDAAFRRLDAIPVLAQSNVIEAGDATYPLPEGQPLEVDMDVDAYMDEQRTAAIVVIHDGKLVMEKYGLGFDATGKWTSFSVAKSLTSTMVGAAIKDGAIQSIDDPVSKYIKGLEGSAYADVSIEQLLTMTSGVRWNEDYSDPNSDVAKFNNHQPEDGMDATVSYMSKLPRQAPAGERWVYNTGETNLIGVLVSEATGKSLADYLSEKVWSRYGMQQDATWLLGSTGTEISGCCVQAATRDMARFGQFILNGAEIDGASILPEGWIAAATTKQADIGAPGRGYGYQWWTYDEGSYAAQGIFGQGIFIDPKRNLVIASNSNWPKATGDDVGTQRQDFYKSVQAAIDASRAGEALTAE